MKIAGILRDLREGPPALARVRTPFLLALGGWVSVFNGLLWLAFVPLAVLGVGTYSIDDRTVSGRYFLTHAGPSVVPLATLLVVIAAGIRMGRSWVRPLILVFWGGLITAYVVACLLSPSPVTESVAGFLELLLLACLAAWYLYGKRSVVAYYAALESTRRGQLPPEDAAATASALGV